MTAADRSDYLWLVSQMAAPFLAEAAASREPLGRGLRPAVASIGDLARMAAALGREQDMVPLRQLRILAELDRGRVRGLER